MLRFSVCLLSVLVFTSPGQPQNSAGVTPNPKRWTADLKDDDGTRYKLIADVYCTPDKEGTLYNLEELSPSTDSKDAEWVTKASGFVEGEKIDPKDAKQFGERVLFAQEFVHFSGFRGLTAEKPRIPPLAKPMVLEQAVRDPRWIYLAGHAATNRMDVLDPDTFKTAASISVEPRLFGGLALSPDGKRLYATLWRSTTATPPLPAQILILDTATNQVLDRITLTGDMLPSKPAVSLDGKLLYFADGTAGLVIVDLQSKTVAQTIPGSAAGGATNRLHSLALSPDGGLICVADNFGVVLLETRTRTFVGRINISLPNRDIPPLIHPNGSRFYIIERRSVAGGLSASLVGFDMAMMTEVSRTALPSNLDPRNLIISPDGLQVTMKGFLQSANAPVKAVSIAIDTASNAIEAMADDIVPAVGTLVSIVP